MTVVEWLPSCSEVLESGYSNLAPQRLPLCAFVCGYFENSLREKLKIMYREVRYFFQKDSGETSVCAKINPSFPEMVKPTPFRRRSTQLNVRFELVEKLPSSSRIFFLRTKCIQK